MSLTKQDRKFLKILKKVGAKSTCLRAKIGALAVKKGKIIAQGDNSFHPCYDCNIIGCIRDIQNIPSGTKREICYGICAEQRLFAEAVKNGVNLGGADLYITSHPCRICEGLIAESGIKRVVYIKGYPDVIPVYDTLKDFGLEVVQAIDEDDKPHEPSSI